MREARPTPPLSEREQQLLQLAGEGFTDSAIANKLGISEATVGTYWGRIRIKMGPYSRPELVGMAVRMEAEATLNQLRADNQKLTEQLERASGGKSSPALYFQVLKDATDAVIVVDQLGHIVLSNASANNLFGYDEASLIGQHISTLVPDRFHARHRDHVGEYVASPTKRRMGEHLDTLAKRKDGTEFLIAAALNTTKVADQEYVVAVVRDVSEGEVLKRMSLSGQS